MSTVQESATGRIEPEEMKGIIEREVEGILQLRIGDYCYIPDYEAFYGKKKGYLLDGDGILRMNDHFIIQSTWKDGIIDGDLILWDTVKKRVVAFMVVQNGIVKTQYDVDMKDTLVDMQNRRYCYQGNRGITDCHEWKEPDPKDMSSPLYYNNQQWRERNSSSSPTFPRYNYVVIPDNTEVITNLSNQVEILIVGKNCLTQFKDVFNIQVLTQLREFHVSHNSFCRMTGLRISRLPRLTKVSIGLHCFASSDPASKPKVCVIDDNPLLQSLVINEGSFVAWESLQVSRNRAGAA